MASLCCGQSFTVRNISIPEGLPSSEVYEVFQDRKGFIWFATDNGVARFDGKDMETFHVKDGLTDPVVFSFYEDKKGRIWFRTLSGKLSYYENGKIRPYKYNTLLVSLIKRLYVSRIYIDKEALWFSAGYVMGRIDALGTFTKDSIEKSSYSYKTVGDGSIIGGGQQPYPITSIKINQKKFLIEPPLDSSSKPQVYCTIVWRNKTYLTFNKQIIEYDGKCVKRVFAANASIISLSRDLEDNLWIGYMGEGVERFSHGSFKDPWRPSFLKNRSVTKVLEDNEGGFWISTLEKGVYYLPNFKIEQFSLHPDLKITAVLATPDYIALGDQMGGLTAYNSNNNTILWKRSFESRVSTLFYHNKKLWVSLAIGSFTMDENFNQQPLSNRFVANFAKGRGDTVWTIGATRISKFDKEGKCLLFKGLEHLYRKVFIEDSIVYLIPSTGLHLLSSNSILAHPIEKLDSFKIAQIVPLNDTTFLVCTIGSGFLVLNKNNWKYTQFDSRNNFIADNIYAVVKNDSMLWLGTEKGVISTYIKPLLNGDFSFSQITKNSGLISDKINFLASTHKDLWVFSDEGFSTIPYDNEQFSNKTPKLYFKKLTINNKPSDFKDKIKLKYNENNIQITFGYISYNNQNIITRFRLNPTDPWIQSRDRNIQFASLSPGDYDLELEYSVDNIHWICSNHPFAIIISPPWWKVWYVQVGAFFILLSLIYIYYKNQLMIYKQRDQYHKVVNEYQQKLIHSEIETLERERSRIAKDLHDGVGTNLTAIKLTVNQLLKTQDKQVIDQVEDQFQNAIKEIKEIIYALTPPGLERYGLITGLKDYIEKLNKTIPIKIELNSFGETTLDVHLSILVFRVIQELISNSLKHAQAQNITIHISSFDDLLNVMYEDDGIGFSKDLIQKGLGLDNIEARIQSVNGNITFESGKFGVSYSLDIPLEIKK